jgi:hypothetical protein
MGGGGVYQKGRSAGKMRFGEECVSLNRGAKRDMI